MTYLRRHGWFGLFYGAIYLGFLWPLIALRQAFIHGDYHVQFYAWTWAYAQALKQGALLLWTPLIQSGFPLFAEGQTGMLYPLNLLLFKFISFKLAYNLMFLAHFLMAGLFMYLFALKKKMSHEAATLAAILFTFGSAYGGCFYNIVTMRSLVWFPLTLFFVEMYFEKRSILCLLALAFAQGQSWLAGFPQTAAYAFCFLGAYFFLRLWELPDPRAVKIKDILYFLGSLLLSIAIGLPQLWATLLLASHSTRLLQDKEFVLWGSVAPWTFSTLFMYSWGTFLKARIYIGIIPLYFLLFVPYQKSMKLFWVLAGLSILLALGAFNPLYWILLKLPIVSLFRNPAKFLFFTSFFFSMIAAFSFDYFLKSIKTNASIGCKWFLPNGIRFCFIFFFMALGALIVAQTAEKAIIYFGDWYTHHFIMGRSFHRGNVTDYTQKVRSVLVVIQKELNWRNPFFWAPFVLSGIFFTSLILLERRKLSLNMFKVGIFTVLITDLFLFGTFGYGTGFVGNLGDFPGASGQVSLENDGKWLDLTSEKNAVFPPNINMLSGHAQLGAYSPLLDKNYYILTKDFGALDDSFGRSRFLPEALEKDKPLIDFLGVRYLITEKNLPVSQSFQFLRMYKDKMIYMNPDALDEFTFEQNSTSSYFTSIQRERDSSQRTVIKTESPKDDTLVRNQVWDEGWKVRVDGKRRELKRAKFAFQGVEVAKGSHTIEFFYAPDFLRVGRWFYIVGLLIGSWGVVWCLKKNSP